MQYYVVKNKETGMYFRGKGANMWGKYYNQASIYRFRKHAENAVEERAYMGEQAEVVEIQITEGAVTDTNVGCKWITFEMRKMDDEEKEFYSTDCDEILCCELPDDGQEILVSYKHGQVDTDVFCRDGYECYLESGCDFVTDAIAWRPLPEPYREEEQ